MILERKAPEPVVILVDRDPLVVATLRRLSEQEPFELRATANPARALKWLEEGQAGLVLADPDMPAVQASDLVRVVEERFPGSPFALLSAGGGTRAAAAIPRVATRPWDSDKFEREVLDLLRRARSAGPRRREELPLVVPTAETRVLLVCPEPQEQALFDQALSEVGLEARFAESPQKAIDLLRRSPLEIDIALVPAQIPGTTPTALLREMLSVSPGLTAIVIAGNWTREEIRGAYQAGAENLVSEGEPPHAVADLLVRSAWRAKKRRAAVLGRVDAIRRWKEAAWHRRLLRLAQAYRDAPPGSRKYRRIRRVLGVAAGLLVGVLLALAIDGVVSESALPKSPAERVLGALERAFSKDPFHESEFQRWYLLERLEQERLRDERSRRLQDERMTLDRLNAVFQDARAEAGR